MGSGCSACHFKLAEVPVKWYTPDSSESVTWQTKQHGFGQGRNKPFIRGIRSKSFLNRKGNDHGELGGKIVFYSHASTKDTNYTLFSKAGHSSLSLNRGSKLFCKAFFRVPLGRMPVGENNIPKCRIDLKGQGPVLLAPCPKAVAIFVDIDGIPQKHEFFCEESFDFVQDLYDNVTMETKPVMFKQAIKDSFFTFMVSRQQDKYFFLHVPLIATFYDSFMDTGHYGQACIGAFIRLFSSLTSGKHLLEMRMKIYFDHCDYNYFPLDKNINARGMWYDGMENNCLVTPHPEPQKYFSYGTWTAKGSCVIDIPPAFRHIVGGILDRKTPRNGYPRSDIEHILGDAKIVAGGMFAGDPDYPVEGLPDLVILTNNRKEKRLQHKQTGYRYRYEHIDFVALWLNKKDTSDNAFGTMLEASMARGEMRPRVETKSWVWHKVIKNGKEIEPEPQDVKNKYIRSCLESQREYLQQISSGGTTPQSNTSTETSAGPSLTARPASVLKNNTKKNGLFPLNTHR